jgi:hypothetical protein
MDDRNLILSPQSHVSRIGLLREMTRAAAIHFLRHGARAGVPMHTSYLLEGLHRRRSIDDKQACGCQAPPLLLLCCVSPWNDVTTRQVAMQLYFRNVLEGRRIVG